MAPRFAGNLRAPHVLSAIFEDEPSRHPALNAAQQNGHSYNPSSDQSFRWPFPFMPPKFTESGPPSYASEDVDATQAEKMALRNNKHIAKRGGWKRLLIIAFVLILCVVGLVVGLIVGLRNKSKSSSSNDSAPPDIPENTTSPSGAYGIRTYLTNTTTTCTDNPATWLCYPYTTYSQSSTSSVATWDWIIRPVASSSDYTVSSTANVFSILFSDAVMSLQNTGTDQEHYAFSVNVPKSTKPRVQLTSVNVQSTCYFNESRLEARLYTKLGSSLMGSAFQTGDTTVEGRTYVPWPYRVDVSQVSPAGASVECRDVKGNLLGDFAAGAGAGDCACEYGNDPH